MAASTRSMTGEELNALLDIGAKHARYREDGIWYHHLRDFPGALIDANGYVIFETEEEYINSPYLQRKKDLNVPKGISNIPEYVSITNSYSLQRFSSALKESLKQNSQRKFQTHKDNKKPQEKDEPKRNLHQIYKVVRDTNIAKHVKILHQFKCQICGNSLDLGNDNFYAESHHIKPLGADHKGPDVVENILCVCPNHHVLLDFGAITLSMQDLQKAPGHEINVESVQYHNYELYQNIV